MKFYEGRWMKLHISFFLAKKIKSASTLWFLLAGLNSFPCQSEKKVVIFLNSSIFGKIMIFFVFP